MLFNSVPFVVFATVFFPVYFLLKGRARLAWTLGASYVFYGWWDWRFLGLIGFSTCFDYAIGMLMGRVQTQRRRHLLAASIGVNLGILAIFKYANFFGASLAAAAASVGVTLSWTTIHIILPVGLSFYTFQAMSYTIDVYRRHCPPEPDLLRFATFIALFPQLVAGPIVRASKLLPQLRREPRFRWQAVIAGSELIAWGYFLKLVLADNIAAQMATDGWFSDPAAYRGTGLALGAFLFSFQIYGDFAGYSLIAIGLGRVMGFNFGMNFRRPYLARSFQDFWRRWHISLSSWFRDYLYIPLGGDRVSPAVTVRNVFVTMLLAGLWHGAAWTFVVWGALHAVYLTVWRAASRHRRRLSAPRADGAPLLALRVLLVFGLTTLAWIFFRAPSLDVAFDMLQRIVTLDTTADLITVDGVGVATCLFAILVALTVDLAAENGKLKLRYRRSLALRAAAVVAVLWGIALLGSVSPAPFLYFQF